MPLSAAKPGLELAIKTAFENVKSNGELDGASPGNIIAALAAELSEAIHEYATQALVITDPGQPVATAGSPAAQSGATTGPGTGTLT